MSGESLGWKKGNNALMEAWEDHSVMGSNWNRMEPFYSNSSLGHKIIHNNPYGKYGSEVDEDERLISSK